MAGNKKYSNIMFPDDDEFIESEHLSHFGPTMKTEQNEKFVGQSHPVDYRYVNSERDLSLPLQKQKYSQQLYESPEDEQFVRKYLGNSVGLVSLITQNLLSHPFVVLRRQCQVHHSSQRYHLQPFTLIPTLVHLHKRQGVTTLWKGLGSCLLVRGMSLAVDDLLSKVTSWPKEINNRTKMKGIGQHILLKCVSIAVVMPFYSASLVETVQSDIASEKPGIFDVFREGAARLVSWSVPQRGRMLPCWALLGPSVALGLSKYITSIIIKGISYRLMRRSNSKNVSESRDESQQLQNITLYSTIISLFTTELLFFPCETILHRLQLQGTRTIVDNLDNGYAVVPILTNYEGVMDCYKKCIVSEGAAGLYKGFGALLLQFAAHIAVLQMTRWVINHLTEVMSTKPPPRIVEYYEGVNNISSNSSLSRSLSPLSNTEYLNDNM